MRKLDPSALGATRATLLTLLTCLCLGAQPIAQTVELYAPPPPPPLSIGGSPVGAAGGTTLYYWVVSRYPIGTSAPSLPAVVTRTVGAPNLTAANYVVVSWSAAPGATGYDVVRSTTPVYPAPCAACAVVLDTAALTFSDMGGAVFAYPPAGVTQATAVTGQITINNRDEETPYTRYLMGGREMRLPAAGGHLHWFDAYDILVLAGDLSVGGDIHAAGDISGDDIDASITMSSPEICIPGGHCWNAANQQMGTAPQYSVPFASFDNQLDGDLSMLRVLPTSGFFGINLPDAPGAELDMEGEIRLRGLTDYSSITTLVTGDDDLSITANGPTARVLINNAAGEAVRVEAAGDVGVGTSNPGGRLDAMDVTTVGTQNLTAPADFSQVQWALAGDFAAVGTDAVFTFAGGAGTVTQTAGGNLAIDGIGGAWYRLQYTIAPGPTVVGGLFTLTNAFALTTVNLSTTEGAHTYYFESAAAPVNFVLDVAFATSGSFTITDASLRQIQGGDVLARGLIRLNPVTFIDLPVAPDGSMIYCVNCTIANPCAAAGPGAVAKRMAGAWVCN